MKEVPTSGTPDNQPGVPKKTGEPDFTRTPPVSDSTPSIMQRFAELDSTSYPGYYPALPKELFDPAMAQKQRPQDHSSSQTKVTPIFASSDEQQKPPAEKHVPPPSQENPPSTAAGTSDKPQYILGYR